MINKDRFNKNWKAILFCSEPEQIENYNLAISDTKNVWECHHRLETHTSEGKQRLVQLSRPELEALDMYFNRPPEEFIFLLESDHRKIHRGKKRSEETRNKMSKARMGIPKPNGAGRPMKPVICIETQVVYKSVSEAARQNGLKKGTSISLACSKNKIAAGCHWQYA